MRERMIAWAYGDEPSEYVLKNARLVNVLSGEIHPADIALAGGRIAGWGDYQGQEELDLQGKYVCPGFIDGHVHLESSMVTPPQFARAVLPAGTTAVIADPHEIANVWGVEGIHYLLRGSEGLPLDVYLMLPTCVPATHMETAGASLSAKDLAPLLQDSRVLGLGEMMNFPGVLMRLPAIMQMLDLVDRGPVDGHAPGLSGKALNAYIAAGIRSDHESTTPSEALEKLRAGMHLLIREGTTARNLSSLLPIVTPANAANCSFCTDDRHPADLLDEGSINDLVHKAIAAGLPPLTAIQMATINTARHYGLMDRGAIAPGYAADLIILDDLQALEVSAVFKDGKPAVWDGRLLDDRLTMSEAAPKPSFNVNWERVSLTLPAPAGKSRLRVIGVIPDQIITESLVMPARIKSGLAVADPQRDLLKIAVVERHKGTGNAGVGFVHGFGMARGALASSVAHDSHNIVTVGASDQEMLLAARTVAEMGGGQVAVLGDRVLSALALPVAGLLSTGPLETVRDEIDALLQSARELGCQLPDPLMTMSFLALAVIPKLKLTDLGLVDVEHFELVSPWAD